MAGHYFNTILSETTGKPVFGATIKVYTSAATISGNSVTSGTFETIYSDDGVTAIDQSGGTYVTTDSRGFFEFWTNARSVVISGTYGGSDKFAYKDVEIFDGDATSLESFSVACSDEVTAIDNPMTLVTFRMPYAFNVSDVRASLNSPCATGTFTVDINEAGTSILSTKLTIDATEKTSTTATTPAVISSASLSDDAEITVDVDDVGDGAAQGLKITLIGKRA